VDYGAQCLLALAQSLRRSVLTTLAQCTRTLFINAGWVNCARKRLFPVAFRPASPVLRLSGNRVEDPQ
jgi:hypothetical protein